MEDLLGIDDDVDEIFDFDDTNLPENVLHFTQTQNSFSLPFVIYADFEAFLVKKPGENPSDEALHVPSGFCTLLVSSFDFIQEKAYVYSGPNVMERFFEHIGELQDKINKILNVNLPMEPLTDKQQKSHEESTHCERCHKPYTEKNKKVRHHCHITSRFLQTICNRCNLALRFKKSRGKAEPAQDVKSKPRKSSTNPDQQQIDDYVENKMKKEFKIVVLMHGMRHYDEHFIVKYMKKEFAENIEVIASNTQRFIMIKVNQLCFLDSYQFLPASLETLVNDLRGSGTDKFVYMKQHFDDDDILDLLLRKGVYCYDYMDGANRFEETALPPKAAFYNKLTQSHISDADYAHAQLVWKKMDIKTMQEYHDLYLLTDVLLLADCFESFRALSMENYDLDPLHYLTNPGLSISACYKMTAVKLELFTNIDQLIFITKAIRGGVSTIVNRYAKAHNKFVPGYNPMLPSTYLLYIDMNSLYSGAMTESLPTHGFKFLSDKEIREFSLAKLNSIGADDDVGYILEVDLLYPKHLHDDHSDYPLAAEALEITEEMLSPYAKELREQLGQKTSQEQRKARSESL